MPPGLRDQIQASAKRYKRSMNAEILSRLYLTFEFDEIDNRTKTELGSYAEKIENRISENRKELSKWEENLSQRENDLSKTAKSLERRMKEIQGLIADIAKRNK